MRTCDVKGCSRKHLAKGLCRLHYERVRYYEHRPPPKPRWINPLVCVCDIPAADLKVNAGQCARCFRKPLALMGRRVATGVDEVAA